MSIIHKWAIKSLEYEDTAEFARVVHKINWSCFSDDGGGHTWSNEGSTRLAAPNSQSFKAFSTLAEADVLKWLSADLIAETEAIGAAEIQKQIAAALTNAGVGVPW